MKTLDEHNRETAQRQEAIRHAMNRAGVACPECKTEMRFYGETVTLTNPVKRRVVCPQCGYDGYKIDA